MAKLINKETNREIKVGEQVTDFRGKPAIVVGFQSPLFAGSEGRIYVKEKTFDYEKSYYPSVFGAKIVDY